MIQRVRYAAFVLVLAGAACADHPTDAELIANFRAHRASLDQIVLMAKADRHLFRVAQDFTWLDDNLSWPRDDVGLTPERWDQYRQLFREAEVREGFSRDAESRELLLLFVATQGLVTGGSAKGYAYSENALEPIVVSLDEPPSPGEDWRGFVWLEGPWYLFYERSG